MEEEIYVTCHAPSLSLLLFETVRSSHDQKGLLIGQICKEVFSKKTDDNEVNQEQKTAIYIEHCIPLNDSEVFENAGGIRKSGLQKYIDLHRSKIIGWYSFRRNTRVVPCSMREIIIHQSLLDIVPGAKREQFVVAFMSASVNMNCSTHSYNHIFMRYCPVGQFEPLKLKIFSLSDKNVNSSGYSTKSSLPTAKQFDKAINFVQKEETPKRSVLAIHDKVSEVLNQFHAKLQENEKRRIDLEDEIKLLKKKLNLDSKPNVVVEEGRDSTEEVIGSSFIRYDPSFTYKPSRKSSPIVVNMEHIPSVPRDEEEEEEGDVKIEKGEDAKHESVRSCAVMANTSPFNASKVLKKRSGLAPLTNRSSSATNHRRSPDLFGNNEEGDNVQGRLSDVNNSQPTNSMEY